MCTSYLRCNNVHNTTCVGIPFYTESIHEGDPLLQNGGGGINTPVQRYITIGRVRAMVVKREAMLGQRRFGGDPDPTAFGTKNSQERLPVKLVANRRSEGIDEQ